VTDEERKHGTRNEVVRLLNQVESLLTGWVLKEDRDEVARLTGPLYEMADPTPDGQ
jgi:hypothetical protein